MEKKSNKGLIVTIVIIAVIAVVIATVLLIFNRDNNINEGSGNAPTTENVPSTDGNKEPNTTKPTEQMTETNVDINNWGREDKITTDDGENIDRYFIRVPRYTGSYHGYCKISEQPDDTVVQLFGQNIGIPGVKKISDIFSSYIDYNIKSLEGLYGIQSSNFKISIDSSEVVTVGDYDMYVHKGIITYDFDGAKRQHQYVAYATKLKDSGNCAYWMVYDFSKDQSKGELIKSHALNMAKSFREEQ